LWQAPGSVLKVQYSWARVDYNFKWNWAYWIFGYDFVGLAVDWVEFLSGS